MPEHNGRRSTPTLGRVRPPSGRSLLVSLPSAWAAAYVLHFGYDVVCAMQEDLMDRSFCDHGDGRPLLLRCSWSRANSRARDRMHQEVLKRSFRARRRRRYLGVLPMLADCRTSLPLG